jgi:hypothetical protein
MPTLGESILGVYMGGINLNGHYSFSNLNKEKNSNQNSIFFTKPK